MPSPGIDLLRERFEVTMLEAEGMPEEVLAEHIKKTDPVGIIGMVNVPITDRIMAAAPHLRVVANYAVGYNNVDVAAATRRGVMVTNTPGVLTEATADLTWALLLAVARRVVESDRVPARGQVQRLEGGPAARHRRLRAGPRRDWVRPDRPGGGASRTGLRHVDPLQRCQSGPSRRLRVSCGPSTFRSTSCYAKPITSRSTPI